MPTKNLSSFEFLLRPAEGQHALTAIGPPVKVNFFAPEPSTFTNVAKKLTFTNVAKAVGDPPGGNRYRDLLTKLSFEFVCDQG